jgi:putative oxidoreductase
MVGCMTAIDRTAQGSVTPALPGPGDWGLDAGPALMRRIHRQATLAAMTTTSLAKLRPDARWLLHTPAISTSAALLVLRTVVGVTFLFHGLDKLGDGPGTERFFASVGIPAPQLMGSFVAVTETVGGMLLIAGLATALAAAALAIDMLVAYLTVRVGDGFFVSAGGFELEFLLAGACVGLVLAGAGRYSLDEVWR